MVTLCTYVRLVLLGIVQAILYSSGGYYSQLAADMADRTHACELTKEDITAGLSLIYPTEWKEREEQM